MKYFYDEKAGAIIVVDGSEVRTLKEIGVVAGGGEPIKKKVGNKKWQDLDKSDEGEEEKKPKSSKLSDIQRGQLEAEVIAGLPTSEIAGRFGISTAYVYIIKSKLRKEGKI